MKFQLTVVACALALTGCASRADRDRLGIQDPTILKTGIGAPQDMAAGAVTPQWLSTYASASQADAALAALQQRLDKLPADKNQYFHAKAQCWINAGETEWHAHDKWGFVEEAIGQAATITFGLENQSPLSAANPELRTVSTVRPDLWKIANVIKSDPSTPDCPEAQAPLACAEVELMLAGHYAWTRNFSAAEKALPGVQENFRKSAEAVRQCASTRIQTTVPETGVREPAITLRADAIFRFNGGDVAALTPRGKAQLNGVVAGLQKLSGIRQLYITGYADRLGGDAYNHKLSLQRALTVKRYLASNGVSLPITVAGMGKANPVVECNKTNQNELIRCLAPNRRVEIEFVRDNH